MIYLLDVIYMYYNMPPQTPYNPYYGNSFYMDPQEYIKQNERKKLRKTSNGIGFYIMAYFLTMQTVAIVIALVFSSLNLDTSNPTAEYLLDIFLSVVASFIPGLIYLGASKFKISEAFKKTYVPIGLLLSLVFIGMALAMVSNVAAQMLDDNLSIFGLENSASMSNDQALNPLQTFLYIFAVSAVPAFAEEFAFRGIVMGRLRKYGNCFAIVTSAVMFGAMHGNTTQIVFAFILGLVFGFVDCVADSIIPSIIIHFLNNFYAVTFDVLKTNTNIDEKTYYIINLSVVVLFCVAGLISFLYLTGRNKNIFKLSSKDKSENEYSDLMTYKEKFKAFFLTPGVIISLVLFLITTVSFLIPGLNL